MGTDIDECPICLCNIDPTVNMCISACKHKFHTSCLIKVVLKKCPMCRAQLDIPSVAVLESKYCEHNVQCAICDNDLLDGVNMCIGTCGHKYHTSCFIKSPCCVVCLEQDKYNQSQPQQLWTWTIIIFLPIHALANGIIFIWDLIIFTLCCVWSMSVYTWTIFNRIRTTIIYALDTLFQIAWTRLKILGSIMFITQIIFVLYYLYVFGPSLYKLFREIFL